MDCLFYDCFNVNIRTRHGFKYDVIPKSEGRPLSPDMEEYSSILPERLEHKTLFVFCLKTEATSRGWRP